MFDLQTFNSFSCTQSRDRTGMDVTPLVFETSASTNSAIWAFALALFAFAIAKVIQVFILCKFFDNFLLLFLQLFLYTSNKQCFTRYYFSHIPILQ